jgi:hypothetical protein
MVKFVALLPLIWMLTMNIESMRSVRVTDGVARSGLVAATVYDIEFAAASGNFDGMWDPDDPTKIQIPRTGIYAIYLWGTGGVTYSNDCTQVSFYIRSGLTTKAAQIANDPPDGLAVLPSLPAILELKKGEKITFSVRQIDGTTVNLSASAEATISLIRPYYPEEGSLEVG